MREIDLLSRLVNIPSGTKNHAGVLEVFKVVEKELHQLGFSVQYIDEELGRPDSSPLLMGFLQGKSDQTITLVTHADTVFEKASGFLSIESFGNKKAKGPGVIDDKGGIVVCLSGLAKYLAIQRLPHFSLVVICSPNEETGSPGFSTFFKNHSKTTSLILGFEPALEGGHIIDSRRGNRWYRIQVVGKEGHAGRAHRSSVNAGHEMAVKLDKLQRLTDYKKDLTVSIGFMQGGRDKFNMVCGQAEAGIDARFKSFADRQRLDAKIQKIIKTSFTTKSKDIKSSFEVVDDCPPLQKEDVSAKFIKSYLGILKTIERKTYRSKSSGGASDVNYLARPGLPAIDGLGAVGSGLHTLDETIELSSLESRSAALSALLSAVQKF